MKVCVLYRRNLKFGPEQVLGEFHVKCRGNRGSLGQKIHFTAYFYYELAI